MGSSPEEQRDPGKVGILQEGNPKGARAACPHVPKDKLVGKKTGLAEQRVLAGSQGKKIEFISFGRWGRQLRRITKVLGGYAESQKGKTPIRTSLWPLPKAVTKNVLVNTSATKRGLRRISIICWMLGKALPQKIKKRLRYLKPS